MQDPNIQYELLTKEIYETLHKAEGINTIDLQHNVKVRGRSGCEHQIDVYWEFEMVGEIHRVAIECKNYNSNVSIGKIRDFFGVLHDIGNLKGIYVTKIGFQSGARKFADYYGIALKELRYPNLDDWQGRVKDITINISLHSVDIKQRSITLDLEWIVKNKVYTASDIDKIRIPNGYNEDIFLFNNQGEKIKSFLEFENENIKSELKQAESDIIKKIDFVDDTFILDSNEKLLKLKDITYTYDEIVQTEVSTIEGEKIAKAILLDVTSGDRKFFDTLGNVK